MSLHPLTGFGRHATSAVAAAAAIVIAAPALAQNTTSGVAGIVTQPDGSPVAGAAVIIVHDESKSISNAVTDAGGRYAARGLRVGGPYTITVTKDGKTEQRTGVFLALAETASIDLQLGTATVVVTGQALAERFNRGTMGAVTDVDAAKLNALASINRNLQDYARTDPRLAQIDKDAGQVVVAGQNNRYNSITIDGVTTNDTFGLEGNNLPMLKQPVSMDAIQSVQVNVSNYDVTQKGYTGANINAVTKSGTNEWKGSVYYVYRDDKLAGQRYNRGNDTYFDPPKFKETLKGFTVGGPVVKDRLFLFANYEELHSSRAAPDFGPVGDARPNVAITPNAIDQLSAIAKNSWGLDAGTFQIPGGLELVVKDALLKVDWTISDNHRASLRYTKTEQTEPIFPDVSASALSVSSHWYTQNKKLETTVAQWFADWTSSFSTEAKVSFRDYHAGFTNAANTPEYSLSFTGALPAGVAANTPASRTLFSGTERSRQFNDLATKTTDLFLSGTWTPGGGHELKGGVDYSRNEIFNAFLQNTKGNYTFSCINSSGSLTYSFGAINCATATAAQVEAAVLENFQKGRPSAFQVQQPAAGKTIEDGAAAWTLASTGLFVQDTWTVNKALTLVLGARVDTQSTGDRPIANAAAAQPVVAGTVTDPTNQSTYKKQTGGFGYDNTQSLDGDRLFQPRLGFNWKLPTPQRTQLRGGLGLFQGAAPTVWMSNPYSNTGVSTSVIGCGSAFGNNCQTLGVTFNPDPTKQPTSLAGTAPRANVDYIEPGLGQPAVWKSNLALDAELPWYGLVAGAEVLHTTVKQGIYYRHLNLGAATRTGSDGRPLYFNAAGYDPNCWTATGANNASGTSGCSGSVGTKALSNNSYNNVLLAAKSTQGGGDAVTLSLAQQSARDFGWTVAYTRTSAKEVSPLTSSVANSNWIGRAVFDPNEDVAANANALIRDRVSASMNWSKAFFGGYKTTVGVFYEGRRGRPYSWTYNNDLNGDGVAGNDLMYIPSAQGSGEVIFAGGAADEQRFWDVVNAFPELSKSKGKVVQRNSAFSPWINTVDLRVSQEVPGFLPKHKGVISLDILNFGNLLNRNWGRTDEVGFNTAANSGFTAGGSYARSFVNYKGVDPATGKYVYSTMATTEDLVTKQNKGESQWAIQISVKYEF